MPFEEEKYVLSAGSVQDTTRGKLLPELSQFTQQVAAPHLQVTPSTQTFFFYNHGYGNKERGEHSKREMTLTALLIEGEELTTFSPVAAT